MQSHIPLPLPPSVAAAPPRPPSVSVVLVVRNEAAHIEQILEQIFGQDYPADLVEVIVVDGQSDDRTVQLASAFTRHGRRPTVMALAERGRSQGLNRAIRAAKNDLIVRLDARTSIATDYISACVETLLRTGADNVGGVQRPIATTWRQRAFSAALSHPFGVGDAKFRLGKTSGYVESVYLGCFRREVFDKVGYFDETSPIISEDADINLRIRAAGGKVYLNHEISAHYKPRERFTDFWRLYYRYGGAKAGIVLKHRRITSWRQTIPPLLLSSIVVLGIASLVAPWFRYPLAGLVGTYLLVNLGVSLQAAVRHSALRLTPLLVGTFVCMHFGYALGYWKRLIVPETPGTYWGH